MARIRHEKGPATSRQTGEIPAEPGAIVADAAASPQAAAAGEGAATVARRTRHRAAGSDAVPQQAGATDPAAAGKAETIQKGDSTMEQDDSPAPRRGGGSAGAGRGRRAAGTADAGTGQGEAAPRPNPATEGGKAADAPVTRKPAARRAKAAGAASAEAPAKPRAPRKAAAAQPPQPQATMAETPAKPRASRKAAAPAAPPQPAQPQAAPRTRKAAAPAAAPQPAQPLAPQPAPQAAAAEARPDAAPLDPANPLTTPGLSDRLAENIARIETLGHRLMRSLATRPVYPPGVEGPGPELYGSVAQAWLKLATEQPARLIEQQVRYWGETLRHVAEAQGAFAQGFQPGSPDAPADRRFKNPLWQTNPFYNFVMRQYQINAEALRKAADDLEIEGETERRRVDWFTRQMIDMLAPTNFLATNPDALLKALETEGESLVQGLENLVRDVETSGGELIVTLADREAFKVGANIGTTPGEVVHRARLFELIQFTPSTAQVHQTPLIVFPPWINKYYILDLKPQNSLLRWLVEQGYTLFVVSWKNPDSTYADVAMDDYVSAYLEAMDVVRELTGERQLNAVGYCIAGTTLSATLALLKQRGDDRVKSATFLTTLTDFSDQGEFTTFLQDDFVGGIEDEVARTGYLSARLMQRTFSFLRANDLIWGPAIRSYMLGETPPAFDLLYWNGDGTNLPGRMVTQYLRQLCQENALVEDGFEILGHRVHLSEVTLPLCAVACEGDHIAPWLHSWKGVARMGSRDKSFILSESGHIAGIVNPPGRIKYGHYISDAGFEGSPQDWRDRATYHEGSWWHHWEEWLARHSGPMVPARAPRESLAPAPGTYVLEMA